MWQLQSPPCRDAVQRSEKLLGVWQRYRQQFQTVRSSASLLKLIDQLFHLPYLTVGMAKSILGVTFRSASLNIEKLVAGGILEELPGRKYGRIFRAREILEVLEAIDPQSLTSPSQ